MILLACGRKVEEEVEEVEKEEEVEENVQILPCLIPSICSIKFLEEDEKMMKGSSRKNRIENMKKNMKKIECVEGSTRDKIASLSN